MATSSPPAQYTSHSSNAQLARIDGEEDATDTGLVAKAGGNAVEAYGLPLGAAASGASQYVDIDEARQRLRDAQTALVALGYPLGDNADPASDIDGIWGPSSREAVQAFQSDRDLRGDGRLTAETYEALLNAYEEALSVQASMSLQDDFAPFQANQALGGGDLEMEEQSSDECVDNTTVQLINLQGEFEANGDLRHALEEELEAR